MDNYYGGRERTADTDRGREEGGGCNVLGSSVIVLTLSQPVIAIFSAASRTYSWPAIGTNCF